MISEVQKHAIVLAAVGLFAVGCVGGVGSKAPTASEPDDDTTSETASRGDASVRMDAARADAGVDARINARIDAARESVADASTPASPDAPPSIVRDDNCPADAPLAVNRVRLYPAAGGGDLAGVIFQGSNEGTTVGFVDLAMLDKAPKEGGFSELEFENSEIYRYVRFYDPQGRKAPLAELEFYHGDTKLSGAGFGTVGSADHQFEDALDGNTATYYEGQTQGGNYIGLDIAGSYVAATPTFTPPPGSTATKISIASATPDAQIFYTTDGSTPTADSQLYAAPIAMGTARMSIRAISTVRCHFASDVADATYGTAAMPVTAGQKSYHLGNSLTDAMFFYLKSTVDSTGVTHGAARWTIPGTTIGFQAANVNMGTAEPEAARNVASFAQSFKPDHFSIQPFADPTISMQGPAAMTLINPVYAANPNVQLWVYAQWPSTDATKPNGEGNGYTQDVFARGAEYADWPPPDKPVPNTWEDTADAQLRYHEAFADYVDQNIGGKPVLIIPGGSALAELKRRVDAGKFPGITNFFTQVFSTTDDLHPSNVGRYLVSLTVYSCLYKQSPEKVVTFKPDDVTDAQATILKQIAWQVASGYARSGI